MNDTPATMNEAQEEALRRLCERYGVEFDKAHYLVHADDSFMMPGYAEGWVGGMAHANPQYVPNLPPDVVRSAKHTIFVGCDREGRISS